MGDNEGIDLSIKIGKTGLEVHGAGEGVDDHLHDLERAEIVLNIHGGRGNVVQKPINIGLLGSLGALECDDSSFIISGGDDKRIDDGGESISLGLKVGGSDFVFSVELLESLNFVFKVLDVGLAEHPRVDVGHILSVGVSKSLSCGTLSLKLHESSLRDCNQSSGSERLH